jgi:hypothetical protein
VGRLGKLRRIGNPPADGWRAAEFLRAASPECRDQFATRQAEVCTT